MRIHLVTPIVTEGIRTLDDVADLNGNGLSITQSLIAAGPASIECEFDDAMAVPGIVAEAIAAERAGADAVSIDCMGGDRTSTRLTPSHLCEHRMPPPACTIKNS